MSGSCGRPALSDRRLVEVDSDPERKALPAMHRVSWSLLLALTPSIAQAADPLATAA